jgi:hypothetical protein
MKMLRSLLGCVGVGLLAACEVPAGTAEGAALGLGATSQALEPGEKQQGTQLHGSSLERMSFSPASLNGQALVNLRLEKGGLVAERQRTITSTTPSLSPCSSPTSGVSRSCGFVSQGVGTCWPGLSVTLSPSGACEGSPVARVCEGTAACEERSPTRLASGSNLCSSSTMPISFTCPASGTYNVMAGPYTSGQSWQLNLLPSHGAFPAMETLKGAQLTGASLVGHQENGSTVSVILSEIINASTVQTEDSPGGWDPTGATWLYRLQYHVLMSGGGYTSWNVCGGALPYAVPVHGLYDAATGARSESATEFTFSCNDGVIAKCYRWGYQPWKDVYDGTTRMRLGHASCTRMARADYCGDGTSHTQDNTRLVPWDKLNAQVIPHPGETAEGMSFEAGWSPQGAECLSHWRWQSLQASCVKLKPPIYEDGEIVNRCVPGQKRLPDGGACASLCDTPQEAEEVFHVRMFNESLLNGADGGVPDGGS